MKIIDLRAGCCGEDRHAAMSWGVIDSAGVVIAQFDRQDHAAQFCEFFEGLNDG